MATTADDASIRDHEELLRFVERFAMVLADSGIPRMPARVFAYVLAEDAERYTAAELASGLRVSLAAISGAVRYLVQVGMLTREREPGSRSDHYRIFDNDVWGMIVSQRLPVLQTYQEAAAEGVRLLKPGSAGARRMRETQEFYAFVLAEQPRLIERWREHRRALFTDPDADQATRSPAGTRLRESSYIYRFCGAWPGVTCPQHRAPTCRRRSGRCRSFTTTRSRRSTSPRSTPRRTGNSRPASSSRSDG